MIYSGLVRDKGQITIPIAVRNHLGLRQGDKPEFVSQGNSATLQPAKRAGNPFAQFRGTPEDTLPGTVAEIVRPQRTMQGRS